MKSKNWKIIFNQYLSMKNILGLICIIFIFSTSALYASEPKVTPTAINEREQTYLKEKQVIKMCNNPNWAPIEFAQNGNLQNMQGIAIDTLGVLEEQLQIKFENVPTVSWAESQQFLKEKKCDILPCAVKTSKRSEYANFTKPYLNLPLAIFTTRDKNIVSGLDEIMDKPWTRQKGSGLITKLKADYPDMKIIETKGDQEALQYVDSGKAYFTIATLPVASHVISKFMLNNLQVAGYTGMIYNLSIAVRDDDAILLSVLDKSLANIPKDKSKKIFRKWVSSSVKEPVTDYKLLIQVLSIALVVILFFVYRQSVLNKTVSKLKISESKQNLEKERLLVTLRSIGDGVITTDVNGKIVLINKITEQLTGWNQQEAIGRPVQEVFNIIDERTGKLRENPVDKVLATCKIVGLANHTALIAKNGARYSIEDSSAPIFDQQSNIIGTVLVYRDVTEKKRAAENLIKVKKLESVGVLAGGIAHDFNNILTAILGNIELAKIYTDSENQAYPILTEAKKASIRAKDLTQQLLTFAKGGDPVKRTSSIGEIVTDSADFVLHGSSVVCDYNIADDLWQAEVDTGQISQVIQNIILNARHAMPDGGAVKVCCQNITDITKESSALPERKYIKITLSDSGSGIPAKYLDKIFDPYFSTKQEGSGLGLAVCHSIIIKHDGNISVQSEANKGTVFTIYLPASQKIAQDVTSSESSTVEDEHKATIMVMDDDAMVRDMVNEMLSYFGNKIVFAENGHEAIEIYTEYFNSNRSIDIIIMDLTIPGSMGGKDAVQEILKIDPEAKVIVASGYSNDPVMAHCQEYGFKASIAKPFRLAELNKLINEVLG